MASILAIVSRKIFEREFAARQLGSVAATDRYLSTVRTLERLAEGGALFLVTATASEQLWLVGVLEQPRRDGDRWVAEANCVPITDITHLMPQLVFESGKGLVFEPGKLGMSLQAPRVLTDRDVALLRAATEGEPARPTIAAPSPAPRVARTKRAASPPPVTRAPVEPDRLNAPPPATTSDLERAIAALAAARFGDALDHLLAAWADHKAAEVADLIDALGDYLARALPTLEGTAKQIDGAWRDIADRYRPADIPRLLDALAVASAKQLADWFDILERFPIDPRICRAAVDCSVRFVASSAGPSRTRAARLAEHIADGRCIPQIEALIKRDRDAWNAKELKLRLEKMRSRFTPPPPRRDSDRAALATLATAVSELAGQPPPSEAQLASSRAPAKLAVDGDLLREVYADPAADAPRLVYADHLQQQGDPRGEFIALQLRATIADAHARQLKKMTNDRVLVAKWLGPLAAIVRDPVFARGFLYRCRIDLKTARHRALLDDEAWATVVEIEASDPAAVRGAHMRSLRRVRGLAIEQLATLAGGEPTPIEAIDGLVRYDPRADRNDLHWQAVTRVGGLRALRKLSVWFHYVDSNQFASPTRFDWLFDSELAKQLTALELGYGTLPQLSPWLDALIGDRRLTKLDELVLVRGFDSADLTVAIRRLGRAQFAISISGAAGLPELQRLFGDFPRAEVTAIEYPPPHKFDGAKIPSYLASLAPGGRTHLAEV